MKPTNGNRCTISKFSSQLVSLLGAALKGRNTQKQSPFRCVLLDCHFQKAALPGSVASTQHAGLRFPGLHQRLPSLGGVGHWLVVGVAGVCVDVLQGLLSFGGAGG